MKEKEFNLSEKRNDIDDNHNVTYNEQDVKEAVRRLKEEFKNFDWALELIDKIFGDKLTE